MFQPGMDQGFARIRYAEMLADAAQERAIRKERAERKALAGTSKSAARSAASVSAVPSRVAPSAAKDAATVCTRTRALNNL
jgi:hypothetical protein